MSYLITSFVSACVSITLGYAIGFRLGYTKGLDIGKALQWVDDFIEQNEKDRARRDTQGRFK